LEQLGILRIIRRDVGLQQHHFLHALLDTRIENVKRSISLQETHQSA
jgi:hypothetical protein